MRRPGMATSDPVIGYGAGTVAVTVDGVTANYTRSGNTVSRTDPAGRTRTVVSDPAVGRPVSDTLSGGGLSVTTAFAYDGGGRLKTVTRPEGDRSEYDHDARGNQVAVRLVAKPSDPAGTLQSTAGFDGACANVFTCNKPIWTRDAAGGQTDYAYDPSHGGVTAVTLPAPVAGGVRPQTRFGYVSRDVGYGAVTLPAASSTCRTAASCGGTADEGVEEVAYGGNFNVASVTRRAGDGSVSATSGFTYDAVGDRLTVDGPLPGAGDVVRYRYDAARRVVGVVGPDPDGGGPRRHAAARTTYDAAGRVTAQEAGVVAGQSDADWAGFGAAQAVTTGYDANGRVEAQRLVAGGAVQAVAQYRYDAMGRVLCAAQRMDPGQWAGQGDACAAQLAGAHGPDRVGRMHHDALGRVVRQEGGVGTADAGDDAVVTYTPNGQVATAADGNGNVTAYAYDGFDRLRTTTYPGGSFEQLTYDVMGNVVSRRLRDGHVLGHGYDALGRRVFDDNPNTNVAEVDATYSYDNLGRLLRAGDQNGWYSAWEYDALGRTTRQYGNLSSNALQYDAAGRLTRQSWADGFFVTYEHDAAGQVTAVRENGGFLLASYAYDDLGRRTGVTRGNGTVTSYGYDAAGRLGSLGHDLAGSAHDLGVTFGYNPAGQIATRTSNNDVYAWTGHANVDRAYGVNALNQLTSAGPVGLGYDARGNLTQVGASAYGYNTRNALTSGPGVQLAYRDPAGLLNHLIRADGSVVNFDHVGAGLATELRGGGGVERRYVHGPAGDEPIVWYEGAGTGDRRWLHADERGSVVAVTDGAGNATAINRYDEYGMPAATNQGRFGYTGQKWIPELGLWDYKARMYSASLGRFMQTDPLGYRDGMNLYGYVGGDPVNRVDPTGTSCERVPTGGYTTETAQTVTVTLTTTTLCSHENGAMAQVFANMKIKYPPGPRTIQTGLPEAPQSLSYCDAPGADGTSINDRVRQTRNELSSEIRRVSRSGNTHSDPYAQAVGRASFRLAPGGPWDSPDRARGQRLLGAIFTELGVPLTVGSVIGNILEIAEWIGLKTPNDNFPGILESPEVAEQTMEGTRCRGN